MASFVVLGGCVDEKVEGISEELRLAQSSVTSPLTAGDEATLVFQVLGDDGKGLSNQKLEVSLSDVTRITFANEEGSRSIFKTAESIDSDGIVLPGAVAVDLIVPSGASSGNVTVIANLGGDKGSSAKTRWVELQIQAGLGGQPSEGGGPNANAGHGGAP